MVESIFTNTVSFFFFKVHAIGSDGGTVSSVAVPQVQAVFPPAALTKKIRVGLQAQPISSELTADLLGRAVAVSPVVTVEPRRRKFHKAITLSMPAPRAHTQGMINQYSGAAPTLRLLCSITGGQNRAVWEDVTGSTPLTFVKDCVSFTTTVSARFWLMDCRNIQDACRMATELYTHMAFVPFMVKFVVFAKRVEPNEAKISVFCMTDDKEDKTLEQQEHFTEVAKSREVEVLEGRPVWLEFGGNLVPIVKSGEQPEMIFTAFRENRLSFRVRVKESSGGGDALSDAMGRISFQCQPRVAKGEATPTPLCTLNIQLPEAIVLDDDDQHSDYGAAVTTNGSSKFIIDPNRYMKTVLLNEDEIHKADIRLSDISNLLANDWKKLAAELGVSMDDVRCIEKECPDGGQAQQAMVMLRLWLRQRGGQATGNQLEQALLGIDRADIVERCIFNMELVTDDRERAKAKVQLDRLGDEIGAATTTTTTVIAKKVAPPCGSEDNLMSCTDVEEEEHGKEAPTVAHESMDVTLEESHDDEPRIPDESLQQLQADIDEIMAQAAEEVAKEAAAKEAAAKEVAAIDAAFAVKVAAKEAETAVSAAKDAAAREAAENEAAAARELAAVLEAAEKEAAAIKAAAEAAALKAAAEAAALKAAAEAAALKAAAEAAAIAAAREAEEAAAAVRKAAKESPVREFEPPLTRIPSKIKTIKKHSKANAAVTGGRPAVVDIEWGDVPHSVGASEFVEEVRAVRPEHMDFTEISTINLEDVSSPNEHQPDAEPMVIISPGDDYSGEIDEVILVQTPGDDGDIDERSGAASEVDQFSPHRRAICITEEHHTPKAAPRSSVPPPPQLTISSDDDGHITSLSIQSEEDGGGFRDEFGLPFVAPSTGATTTTRTTVTHSSFGDENSTGIPNVRTTTTTEKTFGSSSGSDVALHEAGAELSEDDPGMLIL